MFDLARVAAVLWALAAIGRARAWSYVPILAALAYLLALEIASGVTVRDQGPLNPLISLVLVFVGPSGMPRGPLPPLPLAAAVVDSPLLVSIATALVLALFSWRAHRAASPLPEFSETVARADRVELAFVLLAVLEVMSVFSRLLPRLLDVDGM
jgi:hypothetical protein